MQPSTSDFRSTYLSTDAVEAQLHAWAQAYPDWVRLHTLGTSPLGRPLLLAVIGKEPHTTRPAVWVDANMHATELCGTSVALGIAEDVLSLHRGELPHGLAPHVADALREVHFHIAPRLSPDGADAVLTTGRYVRSTPADRRKNTGHARWESQDVDGDGRIQVMRQRDPSGELVESPVAPGMLVPRTQDHPGPYFKVYPEGLIAEFDGHTVPDPHFLGDNPTDFNRNFPWFWAPEPEQAGAGEFPGSEPETRAVIEWATAHPNLFVWLNLHTFGGVFIRPLGHQPDSKLNPGDLAVYRQVEAWATEHTGYPTVSGFHEFTYEPDKPLRGDLSDYAYHQRGCLAYVVELWDLFRQLGLEVKKPFVDHYTHWSESDLAALARWDGTHNQGRLFQPWRPFVHPQLGEVELGGVDIRVGISNPPPDQLDTVCRSQSAAFMRVAALLPRLELELLASQPLGAGLTRLTVRVANRGYLSTYGLPSAQKLPISEPLRLQVHGEAARVVSAASDTLEVGHLNGWGQGLYSGMGVFLPWTRGSVSERVLTVVLEGSGPVMLSVSSCRMGRVSLTAQLPAS